jgi:hypothetical protein
VIAVWIVLAALAGAALGVTLCIVSLSEYAKRHPIFAFGLYLARHPMKAAELRDELRQALAARATLAQFHHLRPVIDLAKVRQLVEDISKPPAASWADFYNGVLGRLDGIRLAPWQVDQLDQLLERHWANRNGRARQGRGLSADVVLVDEVPDYLQHRGDVR